MFSPGLSTQLVEALDGLGPGRVSKVVDVFLSDVSWFSLLFLLVIDKYTI